MSPCRHLRGVGTRDRELSVLDLARQTFEANLSIRFLEKDPGNPTNYLVPFAEDRCALAENLYRPVEVPFVLPHAPCSSAPDVLLPVDAPRSLRCDLVVLAEPRRQHAEIVGASAEDLCRLSEGPSLFTERGCGVSEVLG